MMTDPFVHLHVASAYSLRYGTAPPAALVALAGEHGMDTLGLTDRDGLYGAVRFALACAREGIRPVLGVNLAVESPRPPLGSDGGEALPRRTPARGGVHRDLPDGQRITFLAAGRRGWRSLCRLVTAAHSYGGRGSPVITRELVADVAGIGTAGEGSLVVLLGSASGPGRAALRRRPDVAQRELSRWVAVLGPTQVAVEVVHHRGPGDTARAARLVGLAAEAGIAAVLTNAVRYLERADAPVADVLDAARRLVPLGADRVDRRTAEGYLKSGKEMAVLAEEIAAAAGLPDSGRSLLVRTRQLAERCVLDPHADLGIGSVHLPELNLLRSPTDSRHAPTAAELLLFRCEAGAGRRGLDLGVPEVGQRLAAELAVISELGYASYFLTVAEVVELIRGMGVRCAARGSGAGSLVTYLTGVSDVDPMRYGLLMERFLSPLRRALPDVDLDVESHRRTEVYQEVIRRFGPERTACVAMMETYRARHALRDVGAALGLPPTDIDRIAKSFPHIRAGQIRVALHDLPELAASGFTDGRWDLLFRLAERLDGLPRHVALHPCGVVLSDATLRERTPVEPSLLGFPMSQFDKDDVEQLGLLKLDLLGIRMQSAMSHAREEIARADGIEVDLDAIPRDDPATFELIRSTRTLGCFQIESPGQRELIGKFAPQRFADLIIDISLFRPGPVNSDMVRPFLEARQGWSTPRYLHPDFEPVLTETEGVVVFHEQVLQLVSLATGASLAQADEVRRALGDPAGQSEVQAWFTPAAVARGYSPPVVEQLWEVLRSFGSFGFCKAHAAAFAVPTYQSAWLKTHHTAAFFAGVLTHEPGMYPKRFLLDDARHFGIAVLPLDVNLSDRSYRVERVGVCDEPPPVILDQVASRSAPPPGLPDARAYGIRLALADVAGISEGELQRILAGRPFRTLSDFWYRAAPSRPVAERLVLAGAFDSLYHLSSPVALRRRGQVTRRDLLLQVAELSRRGGARTSRRAAGRGSGNAAAGGAQEAVQLTLELDEPERQLASGLPELTDADRLRAELDVLGLDASRHVMSFYTPLLAGLGITPARELLGCRSREQILVAGAKVATQTPPIRSGRRVIFVTLDDGTGPVDVTFFEDVQGRCAATVFHSWLLVVRGEVRRTGARGVSVRAVGCWELTALAAAARRGGRAAARRGWAEQAGEPSDRDGSGQAGGESAAATGVPLVYATGAQRSAYADIAPAGSTGREAPRRLWHASPGSSG